MFNIGTLFELIHQDRLCRVEVELEVENSFFDATELLDNETRDNLDLLYIDCKNAILEVGFVEGFRTAVGLLLDNGKKIPLAQHISEG